MNKEFNCPKCNAPSPVHPYLYFYKIINNIPTFELLEESDKQLYPVISYENGDELKKGYHWIETHFCVICKKEFSFKDSTI